MDKTLIPEIERIMNRYNYDRLLKKTKKDEFCDYVYDIDLENFEEITLESFEEEMDWEWISKNYCVSYRFIYEYQEKLDMQYLLDNYVITQRELDKIIKREQIDNRFDILDL